MLKKNDDITLEITSLSSLGSGVGHFEKMAVFVEGAVTGDKIIAHIIKVKSSYAVGIIKKILKPSKHRIVSDCEVSDKCGGCSYRHIDYSHELEVKRQAVEDALNRIGGLDIKVEEILSIDDIFQRRLNLWQAFVRSRPLKWAATCLRVSAKTGCSLRQAMTLAAI